MTAEQRTVWEIVRKRQGRKAAISMRDLAYMAYSSQASASTRRVQIVIHDLICTHKKPVCSATGKPSGFYIAETAAEIDDAEKQLMNRIKRNSERAAALRQIRRDYIGQESFINDL